MTEAQAAYQTPYVDWAKKYPPKGLTRGQVKALRAVGMDLANLKSEQAEDVVDRVLAMVYPEEVICEIDCEPNRAALVLFARIIELTYGPGEDAAKN